MHQIYPDGNGLATGDNGLIGVLQRFVFNKLNFHLFDNAAVITKASTLASLTEVTAGGYSEVLVPASAFTLVGLAADNGSVMAAPISFGTNTSLGSVSCYGYYVTDTTNTVLLAAANFDSAPIVVPSGGNFPTVVPVFGAFSQYVS